MLAKKRQKADKIINDLEEQRRAGGQVRTNKVIEAKGALNKLERENQSLAQNKVLQREKRRHDVSVGDTVKVLSYGQRSEEHTSELQSRFDLVCRLLLEKKK